MKKKIKQNIQTNEELISIVLLCDLPGYRMKSYGPTSLISIHNKKLIDFQIDAIKKTFDKFEIIICVGFEAEKICKYIRQKYNNMSIRIVENQSFNSSNSYESTRLSINNTMNKKVLICNGELLINKKTLKLLDLNRTCVLIEKSTSENLDIGLNMNSNKEAQHFSFGAYQTWSEMVYLCGNDVVEHIRKVLSHPDSKKKFIFEALNELIRSNFTILCIDNKFPVQKINNIKTYHNIRDNNEIFSI
jgi:NDP-sugar pyrophosphorylase family protein